jgi:hypothetical protein
MYMQALESYSEGRAWCPDPSSDHSYLVYYTRPALSLRCDFCRIVPRGIKVRTTGDKPTQRYAHGSHWSRRLVRCVYAMRCGSRLSWAAADADVQPLRNLQCRRFPPPTTASAYSKAGHEKGCWCRLRCVHDSVPPSENIMHLQYMYCSKDARKRRPSSSRYYLL